MVSLALRRTARIEIFESSALVLATLMNSLRRSWVSSGNTTRMMLPSLLGLTPRSESRIACSILRRALLSNGVTTAIRASGTANEASWLIGVRAP